MLHYLWADGGGSAPPVEQPPPVGLPLNAPELFLDDYAVSLISGVSRRLVRPYKHESNPRMVMDLPWEGRYIVPCTQFFDPSVNKHRLWYVVVVSSPVNPSQPNSDQLVSYAESDDGINPVKPLVGSVTVAEHFPTNVLMYDVHVPAIVYDPADTAKPYKMVGGNKRGWSLDAINWTVVPWPEAGDNDTVASLVRYKGKWRAYIRAQGSWANGVLRTVGYCEAESFDGPWTSKTTILQADETDGSPWTQTYQCTVYPVGDVLINILRFLKLDQVGANNKIGDSYTELLVSRNGTTFQRVANREKYLNGTSGAWDHGIVVPASSPYRFGNEIFIPYVGADYRHGENADAGEQTRFGIAKIPVDRWQSMRGPGTLLTKRLEIDGAEHLVLNCDGRPAVSIVDRPGFDAADMIVARIDALRSKIEWTGGTLGDALGAGPVQLSINLKSTDALYAIAGWDGVASL